MNEINVKILSKEEKQRIKKAIKKKKQKYAKKLNNNHDELRAKLLEMMQKTETTYQNVEKDIPRIEESETYQQFKEVFERFNKKIETEEDNRTEKKDNVDNNQEIKNEGYNDSIENEFNLPKNKKQLKRMNRMSFAQLKVLVNRPDLVEAWDITASDPLLLLHLKGYKNTVEFPKNWVIKKKGLDLKRAYFKKTFKLPDFIENTGISKLRDPLVEKSSLKMVKQKLKERMNPRLGKIDIDYEVLHDAFFKYQTKPQMTDFGDIYYEGKEEDQKIKAYKPGHLSAELRIALGISPNALPPWIMNMQKFGPPPSYPNYKLPGISFTFGLSSTKLASDYINYDDYQIDPNYFWGELHDDTLENNIDEKESIKNGFDYQNEYLKMNEIGGYETESVYEKDTKNNNEESKYGKNNNSDPYKIIDTKENKNKGFLSNDYLYNLS